MKRTLDTIRAKYPILAERTYLNTPVLGPLSTDILAWRHAHDEKMMIQGSAMRTDTLSIIQNTRKALGRFLTAPEEALALVPNFSIGLNSLLEGFKGTERVLLVAGDYPSINWAFEQRNFPCTYVPLESNLEDRIWGILEKGKTDVLAVSFVQWLDGLQLVPDFFSKLKAAFPEVLILVDGTQFCGTQEFQFVGSGIDMLGASAYKWLLSGYGTAFLAFSEQLMDYANVSSIGFNAANGDLSMEGEVGFARRFEPGHLSCLNVGSLGVALSNLNSIGMSWITAKNGKLSKKAKLAFAERGWLSKRILERPEHGMIFNLGLPQRAQSLLEKQKIDCAQRGKGIRVGFHFYNSDEDLDRLLTVLKAV